MVASCDDEVGDKDKDRNAQRKDIFYELEVTSRKLKRARKFRQSAIRILFGRVNLWNTRARSAVPKRDDCES